MEDHPLLPAGEHTSFECAFRREDDALTLWCPLHVGLEDLGTFEARAGRTTRFVVDGTDCSMDMALDRYDQLWGDTTLVVSEPGQIAVMEFGTRGEG